MQVINIIFLFVVCVSLAYLVTIKPNQLDQKWLLGLLIGSLGLLPGPIIIGFFISSARDFLWLTHVSASGVGATLAAIIAFRIAAPLVGHDDLEREQIQTDDLTDPR